MRYIWLMSLRSLLGRAAQFLFHSSVWPNLGREPWLVSVHVQFKGASPLQLLQALPQPPWTRTQSDQEHLFDLRSGFVLHRFCQFHLWSGCFVCTHLCFGVPGDVLSLVLLDTLSMS